MKASRGAPAAEGDILKRCATMGIPHTPDSVVTTAKCDAKLIAQPQFAACVSARRLETRTPLIVLSLREDGSGLSASHAAVRFTIPAHAIKTKQARQPNPLTAAASGVVARTPPT